MTHPPNKRHVTVIPAADSIPDLLVAGVLLWTRILANRTWSAAVNRAGRIPLFATRTITEPVHFVLWTNNHSRGGSGGRDTRKSRKRRQIRVIRPAGQRVLMRLLRTISSAWKNLIEQVNSQAGATKRFAAQMVGALKALAPFAHAISGKLVSIRPMIMALGYTGLVQLRRRLKRCRPRAERRGHSRLARSTLRHERVETRLLLTGAEWNYAQDYTLTDFDDPVKVAEFSRLHAYYIGQFGQPGVGTNGTSGLTFDGHSITSKGALLGGPRSFSAASKESLDVAVTAAALEGNPLAELFVYSRFFGDSDNPVTQLNATQKQKARLKAIDHLSRKIHSYERFHTEFPGFGGYLPWFHVSDTGLVPTEQWANAVPALDNGQLAWSVFYAAGTLKDQGISDLGSRYETYFEVMAKNSAMILHDGGGRIRGEVEIVDTKAQPEPANYSNRAGYFLNDPYEGMLSRLLVTMFGDLDATDVDQMWNDPGFRANLQPVNFETPEGAVQVLEGHWFSAHEQWAYMVLPLTSVQTSTANVKQVFLNGEIARTSYSAENLIPGLFASTHDATPTPTYVSDLGIPGLARQQIVRSDLVAPYAAFPTIFADSLVDGFSSAGVKYLDVMLDANGVQTPYGPVDSVLVDGSARAQIITWDGAVLPLLAMMGGIDTQIGAMLQANDAAQGTDRYLRFTRVIEDVFDGFGLSQPGPSRLFDPTASMPEVNPPQTSGNILKVTELSPGGNINCDHSQLAGTLECFSSSGFIWGSIPRTDLNQTPIIVFEVATDAPSSIWIELKNDVDEAIIGTPKFNIYKTQLSFPNTGGEVQPVSFDLAPEIRDVVDHEAVLIALSDPIGHFNVASIKFGNQIGSIVATNDRFVFANNAGASIADNSVLANDSAGDGQPLSAMLVSSTTRGKLQLRSDGVFTYTPGPNFKGIDHFTYRPHDETHSGNVGTVIILSHAATNVEKLYLQVLGRPPEEAATEFQVNRLNQGATLGGVASGIFESPERLDPIITQMYCDFLLREAESAGIAFYRNMWQRDGGPQNVRANIISSPEFFRSAGGTNQAWVDQLYQRLLGRRAAQFEIDFHINRLQQGASRQAIVLGFVLSPENFRNLVTVFYQQYFNRKPLQEELELGVAQMAAGASERDVQIDLINSFEYRNSPPPPAPGTSVPV